MTELMMCVAFCLRLYLLGGATGIIGASLITSTSIPSLSHGINAGWRDGIGFVEIGSFVVTGFCCGSGGPSVGSLRTAL
eukprot:9270413-Ditylum_brightwellii.AAC.1